MSISAPNHSYSRALISYSQRARKNVNKTRPWTPDVGDTSPVSYLFSLMMYGQNESVFVIIAFPPPILLTAHTEAVTTETSGGKHPAKCTKIA